MAAIPQDTVSTIFSARTSTSFKFAQTGMAVRENIAHSTIKNITHNYMFHCQISVILLMWLLRFIILTLFLSCTYCRSRHFPPESLNIFLITRLLAGVLQSDDSAAANAKLAQYCHATHDLRHTASHKLLGQSFTDHINTLRQLVDQAIGAPPIAQVCIYSTTHAFYVATYFHY